MRAVERPQAKEVSTESLHTNSAGSSSFSKQKSINLSLDSLLWIELSVKINGVSLICNFRLFPKDFCINYSITSKFTTSIKNKILTYTFFVKQKIDFNVISFKYQLTVATYLMLLSVH
jgi:hypothetical protein